MFIPVMETLLDNKSDSFRAWSIEKQTNISLFLYSGVVAHFMPLVPLYTHWKYLKLSFFDVFIGVLEETNDMKCV